ncbi:MAG: hypothetical protein ACJ718_09290 [Nitrososphaeraceae archaeon]
MILNILPGDGFLTVPLLIHILDLFGTMAFGATGAFRGSRARI